MSAAGVDPDAAFYALWRHLDEVHLYDIGASNPDPDTDGYALDNLHDELHHRGDFGAFRHRRSSREHMVGATGDVLCDQCAETPEGVDQ